MKAWEAGSLERNSGSKVSGRAFAGDLEALGDAIDGDLLPAWSLLIGDKEHNDPLDKVKAATQCHERERVEA
ncbi:TPA: hypothetical protein VDU52_002777 [Pseudomonas aeruginosa]|nr:hypothetical protein [Pseudomonas aeruginosa]